MNIDHADEIVDYICGLLRPPDQRLTRDAWRDQLTRIDDPDLAMKAVINGVQVWEHFPSWHDFLVEYRTLQQRRKVAEALGAPAACITCADSGLVLALLRYDKPSLAAIRRGKAKPGDNVGPFEEMAPCPHCERGKRLELSLYGDEGYWQGRDTSYLRPAREEQEVALEKPEWVRRWEAARAAGDQRPFPEQYEALTAEERPKKPFTDPEAWVQVEEYAGEGLA